MKYDPTQVQCAIIQLDTLRKKHSSPQAQKIIDTEMRIYQDLRDDLVRLNNLQLSLKNILDELERLSSD